MTSKHMTSSAGKLSRSPKGAKAATLSGSSVLAQQPQSDPHSVSAASATVINRTVATHRDALKRLADR